MTQENIRGFQEELQRNAELQERLKDLELNHENLEGLISFAQDAGFDFTLAELKEANSKPTARELSIDELHKAVGGITDGDGYWITTVGFSCEHWKESQYDIWLGVKGTCGSCVRWMHKFPPLAYLGMPGFCCYIRK